MSKNSVIPYFSRFCIVFCIEKLMGKKSKRIASDSVGCCSPFSAVFFFFPSVNCLGHRMARTFFSRGLFRFEADFD